MKLFKKVLILTLAVLSLGSSVAFGCDADKINTTGINQDKTLHEQNSDQKKDSKATTSGQADSGDKH